MENRKALIIDDELGISVVLEQILKFKKIVSSSVETISDAKVKLTESVPDIVFLDNRLPDGMGLDFIPVIKKKYPNTKIIAMTAQDVVENRAKILKNGADHFLSKPFMIEDVYKILSDLGFA